jgi:flagellar biosynthesis anti-sigma factor FlgM
MKITDSNVGGLSSNGTGAAQGANGVGGAGAAKAPQKAGAGTVSADDVQLSNLSAHIRAEDSNSPVRAAQLEKLSAAVQTGTYHVDASEISRKIIDDSTK